MRKCAVTILHDEATCVTERANHADRDERPSYNLIKLREFARKFRDPWRWTASRHDSLWRHWFVTQNKWNVDIKMICIILIGTLKLMRPKHTKTVFDTGMQSTYEFTPKFHCVSNFACSCDFGYSLYIVNAFMSH